MSQQIINVGSAPNDGTGDVLRVSQQKANANFTELYNGAGIDSVQREEFVWTTGAQNFTLAETPTNVVFVAVNGQVLDASQYTLTIDVISITETLDVNDNIIIVYSFKSSLLTGINPNFVVFVDSLDKFPAPVSGVITLLDGYTYVVTSHIDLLGSRIDSTNCIVDLYGTSSETSSITSTGLSSTIALITTNTTIKLGNITLKNVGKLFNFEKLTTMALDWIGVNIVNVPNIGLIKNFDNFIFQTGTFLNSKGLVLDGTFGTLAITGSLLSGDGLAGSIISLPSTATVTRRFRIDKCAVVATSLTVGLDISASASIGDERYILDTVNFAGGGTYLSGLDYTSNKSLFRFCDGITNTFETGSCYAESQTTATTISVTGTYVKANITTTAGSVLGRFTHTANRLTYTGSKTRVFDIDAMVTTTSTTDGNQIATKIYKNGVAVAGSRAIGTARVSGGVNRANNIKPQSIISLSTNDYIEIYITNLTNTDSVTVTDFNLIIN